MAKFEIPEGWMVQAFRFTLDPTAEQARALARHFGARRKAYNWTVATLKADIDAWQATGIQTAKPSLRVLRKRWNTVKNDVCVNIETGVVWWPECSKEAYADGIDGAVDAYWNWQNSRSGKRDGKRMGFPRFKKKGRDPDRVTFTTGAMRVEPDRRHLTLPVIGTVRTHENTRRVERLIAKGRSRVLAITVRRNGTRIDASVRVLVQRPQQPKVTDPGSRVGVDVGVRRLATVATADGAVLERVPNHGLDDLQRLGKRGDSVANRRERDAVGLRLAPKPAGAQSQIETSLGNDVQRRSHLGQHGRMTVGIAQHAGAQPQLRGVAGQCRKCGPALEQGQRPRRGALARPAGFGAGRGAGVGGDAGDLRILAGAYRQEVVA
ncbi:transposase [Mycobacterium tuberculosis MAL020172]|nr:transposase [Mycobacterium tuberculosis MAL020172]